MNPITAQYHVINDNGDTAYHDCLDGCLLMDGEELRIAWSDGSEETVKISLKETAKEVTEFGGEFHGLKHKEYYRYAYCPKEDFILAFADNIKSISRP